MTHTLAPPTCGGVLHLDVREDRLERHCDGDREHDIGVTLQELNVAPSGCEVIVRVDPDQRPPLRLGTLRQECGHIGSITFHSSSARTIADWCAAWRGGKGVL